MTENPLPPAIAPNARVRNALGYIGVRQHGGRFEAYGRSRDGLTYLGLFRSAEEAARAYDDFARVRHGAEAFLNFAGPGERQVVKRGVLVCVHGHDLVMHAIPRPGRDVPVCRVCKLAAQARYRQRQRAKREVGA